MDRAQANLEAALTLLQALMRRGLRQLVLCPGSRSGPLAVAAGLLERQGLALVTAIDERSAAFFALGHGRATGLPAAVITTSGTAVANLLPAVVEADYGAIPLLLLTADRPPRLKGCGANQTVNQEDFLLASLRWQGLGDGRGLHAMAAAELAELADTAFRHCLGPDQPSLAQAAIQAIPEWAAPGPVQLNLPIDEPLHAGSSALLAVARAWPAHALQADQSNPSASPQGWPGAGAQLGLDPDRPGLIVAGPWRGRPQTWDAHLTALRQLQQRTGWPLLADALSGLRGLADLNLVAGYDLLLTAPKPEWQPEQVLRLGPLPASRRLQQWLANFSVPQALISEADPRNLDALGTAQQRCFSGLAPWWAALPPSWQGDQPPAANLALAQRWQAAEQALQAWLDSQLATPLAAAGIAPGTAVMGTAISETPISETAISATAMADLCEPALARQLSRLLPAGVPLVLANSSPVRDWESFAVGDGPPRPVLAFRGASGIDGTLSLACGVAQACGRAVLISGDLALLHDANGWLWRSQLTGQLTILVLDNGGGGIFEQLPIRPDPAEAPDPAAVMDFERLFAMPQPVDPVALAAVHGVPGRLCGGWEELERNLSWALQQPLALLRLVTDRRQDALLRQRLRQSQH
ncbi:MAG TPA: 2-succinyl-5-enolpyruvyl-6-hydroxy-3-cyclohexene-1-carboxylic-acid synthase [Synechococcales bacterium UBA10510]|nr:2-succinyl-5-enolpyruvyl-6-hydroxy-3-cyclohexene-1-carboxylic-acid synthase [Synechococcales bacterium UBA10510]